MLGLFPDYLYVLHRWPCIHKGHAQARCGPSFASYARARQAMQRKDVSQRHPASRGPAIIVGRAPCPASKGPHELSRAPPPRYHAWAALQIASETAFELLVLLTNMITVLQACSSSPSDQQLAYKAITAMSQMDFLAAVGRAATGLVTTTQLARSETTAVRQLRLHGAKYGTADGMARHEVLAATAVQQANVLAELAADVLVYRFENEVPQAGNSGGGRDRGGGSVRGGGSSRGSSGGGGGSGCGSGHISTAPDDLCEHINAVLNSRLGVAAAGAIMKFPDPADVAAALPSSSRDTIRELLCEAARNAAAGMSKMDTLRSKLQQLLLLRCELNVLSLLGDLAQAARQAEFQLLKVTVGWG